MALGKQIVMASVILLTAWPAVADTKFGEKLFHREWPARDVNGGADTEFDGDGLGPMFNARSCVACHKQNGAGGGGGNEHNVDLLTLTTLPADAMPADTDATPREFDLAAFRRTPPHPLLADRASVVVHRFGNTRGYDALRESVLADRAVNILGKSMFAPPTRSAADNEVVALMHTQRNTPALFGSGKIDEIPLGTLIRLAAEQSREFPEVSGKLAPSGGKFGWRGQAPSLKAFVAGACANELGLKSRSDDQPADPLNTSYKNLGVDVHDDEITDMRDFIASLAPPEPATPDEGTREHGAWLRGKRYFETARCNACHVADVGQVAGLYSDLLLHDMGEELSDPAAPSSSGSFGYYGESLLIIVSSEAKQEWRTPPLWGVRHSPPYLHDGRAPTIEAAILAHGGEAEASRRMFQRLRRNAQEELIEFVRSL